MNLKDKIRNCKEAQKEFYSKETDANKIIKQICNAIKLNSDILTKAYEIDNKDDELDVNRLIGQIDNSEESKYKKIEKQQKTGNEIVGTHYAPYGVIIAKTDCDPYIIATLISMAIKTGNGIIFNITDNPGTNYLIIQNVQNVLKRLNVTHLVDFYNDKEEDIEKYSDVGLLLYIGNKNNFKIERNIIVPTLTSGFMNYELYIDDNIDKELVDKIRNLNLNVTIYSKNGIGIGTEVGSIEDAVRHINEKGNNYAAGIIASDKKIANYFLQNVKSKSVFINASPTIQRELDIKLNDLLYKKTIMIYK